MGFRFRKSFGKGPFRATISKSGVGYSVGAKGFRYTKKAGGGTRTTASIPGTGLSWVSDSGSGKQSRSSGVSAAQAAPVIQNDVRRCRFCGEALRDGAQYCYNCENFQDVDYGSSSNVQLPKRWWLWLIIGIALLRGCGAILGADAQKQPAQPVETQAVIEIPVTPATEAPAPTAAPSWFFDAKVELQGSTKNEEKTYILNTDSKKFHHPTCNSAAGITADNKSQHTGTREELIERGYEPCGNCNP